MTRLIDRQEWPEGHLGPYIQHPGAPCVSEPPQATGPVESWLFSSALQVVDCRFRFFFFRPNCDVDLPPLLLGELSTWQRGSPELWFVGWGGGREHVIQGQGDRSICGQHQTWHNSKPHCFFPSPCYVPLSQCAQGVLSGARAGPAACGGPGRGSTDRIL